METFYTNQIKLRDPRLWLSEQFNERRKKNKKYSIRAFAKRLKLEASILSKILSGKRIASVAMVNRLSEALAVDIETKTSLINYAKRKEKYAQVEKMNEEDQFRQITLDSFALISDWYHYAILELTYVNNFQNDIPWISSMLGISQVDVSNAIERLKRLNLLSEVNGKLIKTESLITNSKDGMTSEAVKNLQRSILVKALDAIDNTHQDEKDISSMTFAIDERKLPEAKEKIKKFRREMCHFLENGTQTKVYHLAVQLYPVKNSKENN